MTFSDDTPHPPCKVGVTGTKKVCPWAFEFNTFTAKNIVPGYKALMGEAQVAHAITIFRSN